LGRGYLEGLCCCERAVDAGSEETRGEVACLRENVANGGELVGIEVTVDENRYYRF
jgi:hypothetical protein